MRSRFRRVHSQRQPRHAILEGVQPAIFLDRDNTLIDNSGDLGDPSLVRLIQGVPAGLQALRNAGFSLVVVTNQAGVARGKFTEDDVDAVHQRIATLVDAAAHDEGVIDRFYYCPYHPEGEVAEYTRDHPWRKPHPGMILQAAQDMELDLSRSWLIGDQERDVAAGRAAGCKMVLVTRDAELARRAKPTKVAGDFAEAVRVILRESERGPATSPNGPQQTKRADASASPTNPLAKTRPEATQSSADFVGLRRAIGELTDEIRSDRLRRAEFTLVKMTAAVCQLLALLLATLGFMQMANTDVFVKWMVGAGMVQLLAMTLLVLDLKG